jgi:hypothetical protein
MIRHLLCIASSVAVFSHVGIGAEVLVATNSVWKYLDDGSNPGTAWRAANFNDSSWRSGPAELGYEDGDEATLVRFGTDAANKHITTYFRRAFNVPATNGITSLLLSLLRDDGAVVYLNGSEVFRSNMPETNIDYQTLATTIVGSPEESYYYYKTIAATNIKTGANIIAVEVHQSATNSSDLSFNLGLEAFDTPLIVRGPYLQMGGPSNAIIRWRTDVPTDSQVRYGTNGSNALPSSVVDTNSTTEHVVRLTGLSPATKYFYSIGASSGGALSSSNLFFVTSPVAGTRKPTRLWVLGDSGTATTYAAHVRDSYLRLAERGRADLCLMLGDNAYATGTDEEYQAAVFDMYPSVLQNMFLWPAVGNHDTAFSREAVHYPYLDIFSLPTAGETGGLPSGTEKYYSFDYANIHFICLDSMTSDVTTHGTMLTWLRNDLAATTQDWIIAYFHHPPYTKGSHDSDREWELIQMRTNVVPVLEAAGVDLVLCGHSHSYERSYLIDGHYGDSSTFTNTMKLDSGDGRTNGTGAYRKLQGIAANEGAVYAVAGSSGQTDYGPLDHPAMYVGLEVLGSMIIDVHSNRLDAYFVDTNAVALDHFTIVKDGPAQTPPSPAPWGLAVNQAGTDRLKLQWMDGATTETGFRIERSTNGTQWSQVGATGANATNFLDSGLAFETTYYYRVRAFNNSGVSPFSNTASGRILPMPTLSSAKLLPDGGFRILLHGAPERRYVIERSTNLLNWSAVTTLTMGADTNTPIYFADSGTNSAPRRYYRARVLP